MKLTTICATAVLALALVSCGGKDKEEVKKLSEATEFTADQEKTGLNWYIEFQEKQISELEEAISNVEENLIESKAAIAASKVYYQTSQEGKETEAYKEVKDQIVENNQKIEQLTKDLKSAIEDKEEELGFK